ncbi:DUF2892 domain-containing protein [Alteromonas sp. KS69]|jgi:hypothetical protein|uniref:Inner membrane protein YgaP-like transmembrane domain-containing protein n=2 Tax=Gammaproteobacteria TaxID=1236 RepID=S5AN47_9ALTE|nr:MULTISPECIES: DUF2892 domain-containing protein [Gammaproteobacteria]AGP78148.1 hypothetical protein I633_11020 [Alteromonas mediterranea 615]APE06380.1 hypothetical protein BM528_11845 [Alteromonas sp. RW2A1]AUC88297.1 DUF2892 domain-containing protein [Alteromonas sp. MB-3u-76]MDP4537908.1 DUF2892 domain-containing protein [Alkalimonas collagenimarina]RUP77290.1 DUF2892 domain-containing protein [Alteromonas sp. KS69]|tara:strand:+ start:331 stop:564 length:234 start_codon:yes stop_codon:yes gene_type:complete
MSSERALTAFAGFMVLLSVILTIWLHPYFVWFTVFVGVNLFQQSFTGFCPATIILKKLFGLKSEREIALEAVSTHRE